MSGPSRIPAPSGEWSISTQAGLKPTKKAIFIKVRGSEIDLARKVISGHQHYSASSALWFFRPQGSCPAQWYSQGNAGRFKAHCFYKSTPQDCPTVY